MGIGHLDGRMVEEKSIPLNRLEEMPVTSNELYSHINDATNPHGAVLYQDGIVINNSTKITSPTSGEISIRTADDSGYAVINCSGINIFEGGEINQVTVNDLNIEDNFIILNSDATGVPVLNSGININRGNYDDVSIYWDEGLSDFYVLSAIGANNIGPYMLAHDGNTYNKTQADARFVNVTGDLMTDTLRIKPAANTIALSLESQVATGQVLIDFLNGVNHNTIEAVNGAFKIRAYDKTQIYRPLEILSESGGAYLNIAILNATNPNITTAQNGFDFNKIINAPGFNALSNKIINVANPVANSDAVNLGFADGRYINVTGDTMQGDILLQGAVRTEQDFIYLNYTKANRDAGFVIDRGSDDALLYFRNSDLKWVIGTEASGVSIVVTEQSLNNATNTQTIYNIVGAMVSGNTENGLTVSFTGTKLNFDVNDPVLSLSGDVSGSATMTNLGNTNIIATVADDSHNHTNLTGTTSASYKILSAGTGVNLKAASGALYLRNLIDTDYADLHVKSLYAHGPVTEIFSETLTVADNVIILNSNITGTPTENAGIEIERGTSANAQITWNEATDLWEIGVAGNMAAMPRYDSTLLEYVQDSVGAMVSSNTESGISVTYDDAYGKLNFDVNDPVITLTGNVTGSGTLVNLANLSIATTVHDSDKLDGLHLNSTTSNTQANAVVRTDASGYVNFGWINTVSGDNGTTAITRVYASDDAYLRYYSPLNFANQILALGTVRNAHTHGNIATNGAIGTTANLAVITGTSGVLTTGTIPIASGGTGAMTAATALVNLGLTATAAELNHLDGITANVTELNYTDGVTSNIQTQLNAKQATITGAATTITSANLTASRALVSDTSGKVAASSTITSTELGYLDGVTSNIQTQLNAKQATITGAATTITSANLAASMALVSDASGKVAASSTITSTELGHLDGVMSNIQTQLNNRSVLTHTHTVVNGKRITCAYNQTFAGAGSYREVAFVGYSGTDYAVGVTATSSSTANNGDIYVLKYASYCRIYNTGLSGGTFDVTVIGTAA